MVFDYFHIVKNFNDKVVGEIRKDEQKRLIAEGDLEAAKLLKHSKYIVTSSRETLARKDREAKEGKVLRKKERFSPSQKSSARTSGIWSATRASSRRTSSCSPQTSSRSS